MADRLGATVARTAIPWYLDNWEALDRAYESFFAYGVRPIFSSVYVSRPPEPTASPATPAAATRTRTLASFAYATRATVSAAAPHA